MILRAAWIVPSASPAFRDGFVEIADGRIVRVGRAAELPRTAEPRDLGAVALLPGLVNSHTHLELTCYGDALPPQPLWPWFDGLVRLRRGADVLPARPDAEVRAREAEGVAAGVWESLRSGVTCLGDISRRGDSWRVLKDLPIRAVCFAELLSIANDPPRDVSELEAALDGLAGGTGWPAKAPRLRPGISPHAPFTVTHAAFAAAIHLAHRRSIPWTTHWAESREEVAWLRGDPHALPAALRARCAAAGITPPGCAPLEFLQRIVGRAAPGLLAHGNHLAPSEFPALAAAGHTVVYCPRAHAYFDHPPYPLHDLRASGVRVVLGTDSRASNSSLNLIDEARFVLRACANPPSDAALLRMLTSDAAAALGLERVCGSLAPGLRADLAAWPLETTSADPIASILREPRDPVGIWVDGAPVALSPPPTGAARIR